MAFPPQLLAAGCGTLLSALSMTIYALTSPQKKLHALVGKIAQIKHTLHAQDDPPKNLVKSFLKHSVRHSALTLLPTLLALIPVMWAWSYLDHYFDTLLPLAAGPDWFKGWHLWFAPPGIVTSLWIKQRFKIV